MRLRAWLAALALLAGPALGAERTVFIGSAGPHYAALAEPGNVARLLAAGNIGLYQHGMGNASLAPEVRTRLWATWHVAGTGGNAGITVGEVGAFPTITAAGRAVFGGDYPAVVNMNVELHGDYVAGPRDAHPGRHYPGQASDADLAAMRAAIARAREAGARNIAVVATPNGGEDTDDPFATAPFWANIRTIALEGGGLALDPPPSFWRARGPAYQGMIRQMLAWARAHRLRTSLIVSPFALKPDTGGNAGPCGHDPDFVANTRLMLAELTANRTLPTEWIVEAYGAPAAHCGTENDAATDDTPGSLNEVALILSQVSR